MDAFKDFLTSKIADTAITNWMVIVAAVAVVIILAVIIGVAASRSKRKKKEATAEVTQQPSAVSDTVEPVISVAPSEQTATIQTEPIQDTADAAISQTDAIKLETAPAHKVQEEVKTVPPVAKPAPSYVKAVEETVVVQPIRVAPASPTVEVKSAPAEAVKPTTTPTMKVVEVKPTPAPVQKAAPIAETKPAPAQKAVPAAKPKTTERPQAVKSVSAEDKKAVAAAKVSPEAKPKVAAKKITPAAKPAVAAAKKPSVVGAENLPKAVKRNIKLTEAQQDIAASESFGKYIIVKNDKNPVKPFKFELRANNGQLLFDSEPYKVKPRESSIEAFKKHVLTGEFSVDEDKSGSFRYKLYTDSGKLLGVGESYKTRQACLSSIESVKRFSVSATSVEDSTVSDTVTE